MMPQACRATNVLKRVDVARGVAVLILTVKVEVPVEFYKQHRREPTLLVDVAGVRGVEEGEGNDG